MTKMAGTIKNKESFLNNIAQNLGRPRRSKGVLRPEWKHRPQDGVLQGLNQDELLEVLKEQCIRIHTTYRETNSLGLYETLKDTVMEYGGGPVITWDDPRFREFGLSSLINDDLPREDVKTHIWDTKLGDENIKKAEEANVGITFSDQTLAESGTVVLFSGSGKGRSVSLLPATYIAIIPKSTLVPRITQTAQKIHMQIQAGEEVASCVNFISGPSNSADIEMNLVVGVHGPIKATYIVVGDR
ncbi:lactate utilization protein C [Metabacillus sp. KIGAM252]|uniref:Lactate utilization protein C n=1 Tax=Metabacillus flavus TaxID=2823519 RepID=A0ABS5LBM3_9BACI|nr:lactate utilization protein C [Metabacillus flavus]MBS2968128.1 lactate utilization protein C [Metabacillus flavus]